MKDLKLYYLGLCRFMYHGRLYKLFFFGQLNNISIKDMCGIIVVYVSLEFAVSIQ